MSRRRAGPCGPLHRDFPALGCTARLVLQGSGPQLEAAAAAVRAVVDAVDAAASRFRPDSELMRLQAAAGARAGISPLLSRLLRAALEAASWTGGLVDPTVGDRLADLGYDRAFTEVSTGPTVLRWRPAPAPGFQRVELDPEGTWVRLPPGTRLDLGATAKGVAADLAADAAASAVGTGVLVSLGGDLAAAGDAPAQGWPVLVRDATTRDATVLDAGEGRGGPGQTVTLRAGGLATSGTSARRWQAGGSWLHHLLDPRTGLPVASPWRTVSVAAGSCALADAAATAAVILGREAPGWLAARGLPARLVTAAGDVVAVAGWPGSGQPPRLPERIGARPGG